MTTVRSRGAAALFVCLTALLSAAPPTDPAPAPAAAVTADKADRATATGNRQAIESGLLNAGTVMLPPGTVTIDRALVLTPAHSGGTLRGAGMNKTTLAQPFTAAPYWQNQTVGGLGTGVGYQDGYKREQGDAKRLTILPGGFDPASYAAGRTVYLWRWNGWAFPDGKGTAPTRRRVAALDAATGAVTLDGPIPPDPQFANGLKWLDGCPVNDLKEGDGVVTCTAAADAAGFAVGGDVMVTDGPSIANEADGQFRTVAAVDAAGGTVTLDRPLRRAFKQATLARIRAVRDFTVADLTVARPASQAEALLFKFARGLRLERARVAGPLSLASCWDVTLADCESVGVAFNVCHDGRVLRGRYGGVWGEEGVHDLTLDGCLVTCDPAAWVGQNGVGQGSEGGCERWRLVGVRVEGYPNSPLSLGGRENVLESVTVGGSRAVAQPGNVYLSGDGLRVVGLRSDRPVVLLHGVGQSASQVVAPTCFLGWVDNAPSAGVAVDCGNVKAMAGAKWKVWP